MKLQKFADYGLIYNEKFETVLPTIESESVDCVIIDPPNLLADDTDIQSSKDNDTVLYATMDFYFLAKQIERITKKVYENRYFCTK